MTTASEGPTDDDEGLLSMPAFDAGGRVERTGIALVHEGEYVLPAPGSQAVFGPADPRMSSGGGTWIFPVEVEVIGQLSDDQIDTVARRVFDELDIALRRRGAS